MRPIRISAPPGKALRALAAVAVATTLLATSACGGDSGGGASADGKVTLRFNWWGSDTRHKITQQVIDQYEKDHPNVDIKGEFGEWSGYWDKLATTVAANDAPDIIQMDEKYLREYADRGALLDLKKAEGLDTGKFEPDTLGAGEFDGGLYGLNAGINAFTIVANPAVFKAAGVAIPDDTTWTWDDYAKISAEISQKLNGKGWGTAAYGTNDASLNMWSRQHGESLFTQDGKLGVTKEGVTEFYTNLLKLRDMKATPSAEFTSQDMNAPLDQSGMATGKLAMSYAWSNQLNALSKAAGQQLKLLRLPSVTGKATENGAYYKGSMFWSISSRSKHQKEAAEFVSYLANSPAAGNLLLAERGVPPNTEIRAAVASKLQPADAASQTFVQGIAKELGKPSPPPPVGGGQVEKIIQRYTTEVMFGRMKPDQAAQAFIDELNGELK
ncbi:carbohydrate ABC transporter substrate-binding protein (CUT1 family) [Kribbella amoyensis]|uniref:Carbohydrate ABC transporter substrate-binding protein (CUT1 family) n=1 Tax=Kribbella amoyensis TaxID=996641 RepID=A0A561BLL8_9ACTN|nr:extracellular solute-binding protein [Kribbella amoyensis]TWD79745.1 carbohydrate ABC transporter substrate-binding protein (CUT1 family) [Kribbella amoyensis]